jgi:undecaprenyl-phosphate 4-deoxy-4-formamido-L-arabinose transferase
MLVALASIFVYIVVIIQRWFEAETLSEVFFAVWDRDILEFFLIGLVLFGMGLLGEYIGRIFEQVRQRPRYLIQAILEKKD